MKSGCVRPLAAVLSLACVAGGCAAEWGRHGAAGQDVAIAVRNPSASTAQVRVCAPAGCSLPRALAGGQEAEFRFSARGGTRAVVTAKRGDRVIAQQAVDFQRGGRYSVVLVLP